MELSGIKATGFATIRDPITGEVFLDNKKNAIHLGNLSAAVVQSLCGDNAGFIRYMAFGNGGSVISETGQIIYRNPNVSNIRNATSSLHNETFKKEILNVVGNEVSPILTNSTYSDIKILVTLASNEPSGQEPVDRASTLAIDDTEFTYVGAGQAVFDEIALYCGIPGISGSMVNNTDDALLVTHLIFHPIQKSANRVLEIDYTIRIQLT